MPFPPLIERELRVALRKKRPVRRRLITASICVAGALLFLLISWLLPGKGAGQWLHQAFCVAGIWMVLRALPLAAGAFAEERGAQTLGLLFLSGLGPAEVFASKALSAALVSWTDLLALFPMLALPFFIGGVSFDLFMATVFTLPTLLLFVLSLTLLASVLTEEEGAAVVLAAILAVVASVLPPGIFFAQAHFSSAVPPTWWLRLSPAYAPWLVWHGRAPLGEIWSNLGVTLAWSGSALLTAAMVMKGLWREQAQSVTGAPWRESWRRLIHGGASRRRALAARWLDANPFVWLAARDCQSTFMAWAVVGGITTVWLLCWAVWRARWPSVPNIFLTVTLLNLSLYWLILHAAAKNLAQARRDGTFELLLTTRLQPSDMVWGGLDALQWQFRTVGLWVLVLDFALIFGGLATRRWSASALFVYGVAAGLLLWWAWGQARGWRFTLLATWAGLNSARPAFSVWRVSGLGSWVMLMNLYNLRHAFSQFPTFPSGSFFEVVLASVLLVVALIAWPVHLFRRRRGSTLPDQMECRLISELREIAREPVPDRDHVSFKRWNPRERFPWGWELIQEQLHERVARRHSGG